MSVVEETGGFELRRLAFVLALVLTVAAIAVGTWVLGSGDDFTEPDRTPLVADLSAPTRAEPPLSVAPPPGDSG
ncbi:hypothetical protein [Sporichthya polymorpha]|uniref:hypothetical protein n=1 Tax=Sporichthya polymorpha TaxID=35751 RepID=UPI000374F9D6|nr:hypothetical protein [Sporichthya polymorpha]